MKLHQVFLGLAFLSAACSSPKYVYHFDHYDYNSGAKKDAAIKETKDSDSPLLIDQETVVATTVELPVIADEKKSPSPEQAVQTVAQKYNAMSKGEKKEFRRELKKELKNVLKRDIKEGKRVKSTEKTKAFDAVVSLAILFGGAGIVLIMLANISNVFWVLGAISLVIGAYFFVKWVANGNG